MADVIGSAYYELEARDQRARATIDKLEGRIKAAGGAVETQYAAPATAAINRTSGAWDRAGAAAKSAGEALPTERVGGFSGALASLRGRVGGVTSSVGSFASGLKDRLGGAVDAARTKLGGFGSMIGQVAGQAGAALTGPLAIGIGGGIAASIIGIGVAALGASAEMETYRVQFETLLGSATAAQERLDELAKFAAQTPFDLPGVVKASRTLEVFSNGAISTGDSLTLIGDAAASVNVPFEEVAFWTGRLYAAMKGGQPIGEMMMRLSEMGIVAPEVREKIEEMAAGISKGTLDINDAWPVVEQAFGRFSGGMERQSQTLAGRFSTFMDDVRMALARFGDRIAPLAKEVLPALGVAIAGLIDGLGTLADVLGGIVGPVGRGIERIIGFRNAVAGAAQGVRDWFRDLRGLPPELDEGSEAFGRIGDAVEAAGGKADDARDKIEELADHMEADTNRIAERVSAEMERTGVAFDVALERVKNGWDALPTAAEDSAVAASRRYAAAMEAGAGDVEAGVEAGITEPFVIETEKTKERAEAAARAHSGAYAEEIAGGADIVEQAWEALLSGAESEMSKTERIADIKAKLTSSKLREALASEDPFLAAQAEATRQTLETELAYLENDTHEYARRTGKALPDALRDQEAAVRDNAARTRETVKSELAFEARETARTGVGTYIGGLESREGDVRAGARDLSRASIPPDLGMYDAGRAIGVAWANGLRSSKDYAKLVAWEVAAAADPALHGLSPPKEGPLRTIDQGGANIVRAWANGMLRERDRVRAASHAIAGAFMPDALLTGLTSGRTLEVRVRHEIDDPRGALATLPGGAPAVAAALNALDAGGLVRNMTHLAGVN